jgi:hypothetical protein
VGDRSTIIGLKYLETSIQLLNVIVAGSTLRVQFRFNEGALLVHKPDYFSLALLTGLLITTTLNLDLRVNRLVER